MDMNADLRATCMPGHTRRPNPNGIVKSLSTLPFQFPTGLCGVRNREGFDRLWIIEQIRVLDQQTVKSRRQMVWSFLKEQVETYSVLLYTVAPLGISY